ncbi:hypothetical protein GGS23DRAFT_20511 [Durotheca rogersii]|uniref:uncharacterized protein n=1 Tax=Durotheca rogersii TaxID=419775 RepID=UPI00221E85F7|nr:uncharacterized protein GGS23DRAFT_20511 [Durotheca rogersii]KAI5868285.1 hypothetical protein GGS23DRAFT_20511 [Durotheca rogersii]
MYVAARNIYMLLLLLLLLLPNHDARWGPRRGMGYDTLDEEDNGDGDGADRWRLRVSYRTQRARAGGGGGLGSFTLHSVSRPDRPRDRCLPTYTHTYVHTYMYIDIPRSKRGRLLSGCQGSERGRASAYGVYEGVPF